MKLYLHQVSFTVFILTLLYLPGCSGNSNSQDGEAPQAATPPTSQGKEIVILDRSAIVAGTDIDRNGIRDDIDQVIIKFNLTPEPQMALVHVAKTYQDMLVKGQDPAFAEDVFNDMEKAIRCFATRSPDYEAQTSALYAATINTETRYAAAINFQNNLKARVDEFVSLSC